MRRTKPILFFIAALTVFSCSRKKDSWTSRTYHQGVSRYNTYFNGEQAYIKGVATVQSSHKDDFYKLLHVYKLGDESIRQGVVPDMDRAVEKGTKVIMTHSMEIKGKEKNKYIVKSYMLIGKARFYKGDYFPALETFNYVIQNYSKSRAGEEQALEAHLWAAKCQVEIGNNPSADGYLDVIYRNKRLNADLKDDVAATMAQMNINKEDYEEAYTNLREAVLKTKDKADKTRYIYIMGQLQELLGNRYEASSHFKKVVSMKPNNYDMLFTAQLKRAMNFDVLMESSDEIYRDLEKMARDEKNTEMQDQIYFVMAQIAIQEEDYATAEKYLKRSVETSVNNKKQKGESYTQLADISFEFRDYVNAQAYYDSAYTIIPRDHEKFEEVEIRKSSLTELVEHITTIEVEDSLQKLSNMSLQRQQKLVDEYIEFLKDEEERKEEEERIRQINLDLAASAQGMDGGPNVGGGGGWYFYNEGVRSSGVSTFMKKWGDRPLEDHWRQKNKTVDQIAEGNENTQEGADTNTVAGGASKPTDPVGAQKYDPNFYLAQIPKTEEDIDSSNQRILRAYVALGRIYYQDLKDWNESVIAYEKSISRFPGNQYEPRTLYFLFLINTQQRRGPEAEKAKSQLINNYPNSEYAQLLMNPDGEIEKDDNYFKANDAYTKCFDMFSAKKYKSCMKCISSEKKKLKENALEAKFALLEAYCIGKVKKQKDFEKALQGVVDNYAGTDEAVRAKATLDQIGALAAMESILNESPYKAGRSEKHRFIVVVQTQGINLNQVRNDVTDYNEMYHKFEKLSVKNSFLDGQTQMLMVTGFDNADMAEKYLKGILRNQKIMGYLPAEVTKKLLISESNFKTFYGLKNVDEYMQFFYASYKTN